MLLSACASTGDIAPKAHLLRAGSIDAGSTIQRSPVAPWTDEAWWHVYGDPQLDALVDAALAGNPAIQIAADRIAQAQAVTGTARAALLPTINSKAEFQRLHFSSIGETPPPLAGGYSWDNNIAAKLSYNLDLWGRNRAMLKAALGSLRAAELDARMSTLSLQTAVVRSYLQLAYGYALQEVLEATLAQRQSVVDITRRRHGAGLVPLLQVNQAETEIEPVKVRLEQTANRLETLRNQIAALTGRGPGAGESITRPRLALATEASLPSTIPADLLGRRPDVVAARWRIEAAGRGIDAAKAAFYPNVNLSAFAGLQSLNLDELLQARATTYGVAPAISLPLFDGGRLRANLAGRTAAYDLAVDDYNQIVLGAMRDVADQIATVGSTTRQRRHAATAVTTAQQAYDEAQQGFRAGLTDFLTVLSTQTALLTQRQELAQIGISELDARATLMQALGGGFQDRDDSEQLIEQTVDAHRANPTPANGVKP